MKKKPSRRQLTAFCLAFALITAIPNRADADFWGGDIPLLIQIVANTLQELAQLRALLSNGEDTLGFIRDINAGIRDAMGIMVTMNQTMHPGVLSEYQTPEQMLQAIHDIYGIVPQTPEARIQDLNDQSVAEAVTLHNQAFQYADQVDPEAERIKAYARDTSPAGSAKLTAQSLGVLINVSNQILRTNAAMLKIMSESLALGNRHEKVNSEQFRMQYDGLSSALSSAPSFKESTQINP